jgi:biotin carboxyl carrier protein
MWINSYSHSTKHQKKQTMKILAKNGKHHEEIKVIKREGPMLQVSIGNREYSLDVEKVEDGVYSVLHNGTSHNMEIIKSEKKHFYAVNTQYQSFNIEIAPAGSLKGDKKRQGDKNEQILAPIPGKVISIKATPGDVVKEGQTIVVLSAMKMENELKSPIDGIVSKIHVKEDAVVKENSVLVDVKAVD